MWRDGSCFSYSADQPPELGPSMFQRDVDYVSGAFLMTRRELFERLGRFDEALAPAYYEETDYCLRLWQAGYRVVFDPGVWSSTSSSPAAPRSRDGADAAQSGDLGRSSSRTNCAPSTCRLCRSFPLPARSRDWDRIVGRALVLWSGSRILSGDPDQRRAVAMVRALEGAGWFVTVHPLTAEETGWDVIRASLWTRSRSCLARIAPSLQGFCAIGRATTIKRW